MQVYQSKSRLSAEHIDLLGASLSSLCALHCALIPVLLILLPSLSLGFFASESLEHFLLAASLTVASFSLYRGFQRHRNLTLALAVCFSATGLGLSWWIGYERLSIFCGASLAVCHIFNYRLVKAAKTAKA